MMANAKGLLGKMDAAQKKALLAACNEAAGADGNDDGATTDVVFTTVIKGTAARSAVTVWAPSARSPASTSCLSSSAICCLRAR